MKFLNFDYCDKNFYKQFRYPTFSFIGSILDKWFINNNNLFNKTSTPLIIYGT